MESSAGGRALLLISPNSHSLTDFNSSFNHLNTLISSSPRRSASTNPYAAADKVFAKIPKPNLSFSSTTLSSQQLTENPKKHDWLKSASRGSPAVKSLLKNLSVLERALIGAAGGGIAGAFTYVCLHPLDTVKTKLQTKGASEMYKGAFDVIVKTFQSKGILGFYSGVSAVIVGSTFSSAVYFGTCEFGKSVLSKIGSFPPVLIPPTAGAMGNIVSSAIMVPKELITQRMQAGAKGRSWQYTAFLVRVNDLREPSSYATASRYVEWVDAINTELEALERNHTWELTTLPPDDVLVTSPSENEITRLKVHLDEVFSIKDLGDARFFLGMEIARGVTGTYLSQRKYILDLLEDAGMVNCKSASTPLPLGIKLTSSDDNLLPHPEEYRRIVGRLLYLNLCRPDLSYAVQQLSQFVARPASSHWTAAQHVLRYLKGCPSTGLFFPCTGSFDFTAYSDADWGSCIDTRRSLTGYCIFFGTALISWRCKKQPTVSASSAEAEYRALSSTVRELIWVVNLSREFGISVSLPIPLFCDNQAALHITRNPVFHERTKHLDIDCHLVRDRYKDGFILPQHLSSHLQLADLFTKVLSGPRFRFLQSKMGMVDFHHSILRGGVGARIVEVGESSGHKEDGAEVNNDGGTQQSEHGA